MLVNQSELLAFSHSHTHTNTHTEWPLAQLLGEVSIWIPTQSPSPLEQFGVQYLVWGQSNMLSASIGGLTAFPSITGRLLWAKLVGLMTKSFALVTSIHLCLVMCFVKRQKKSLAKAIYVQFLERCRWCDSLVHGATAITWSSISVKPMILNWITAICFYINSENRSEFSIYEGLVSKAGFDRTRRHSGSVVSTEGPESRLESSLCGV